MLEAEKQRIQPVLTEWPMSPRAQSIITHTAAEVKLTLVASTVRQAGRRLLAEILELGGTAVAVADGSPCRKPSRIRNSTPTSWRQPVDGQQPRSRRAGTDRPASMRTNGAPPRRRPRRPAHQPPAPSHHPARQGCRNRNYPLRKPVNLNWLRPRGATRDRLRRAAIGVRRDPRTVARGR